ncbi:MAG: PCRF domain-containing protein, partial [FCB group bacterium]|nr:PCRF domain-containing protein [FCB group bacterium]
MIDKIRSIIEHYEELGQQLTDQAVITNQDRLKEVAREHSRLEPIVSLGKEYISLYNQIEDDKQILAGEDEELKEIAKEELVELEAALVQKENELKVLMLPEDPNDSRNTIVEIRAGTGGEEAAL